MTVSEKSIQHGIGPAAGQNIYLLGGLIKFKSIAAVVPKQEVQEATDAGKAEGASPAKKASHLELLTPEEAVHAFDEEFIDEITESPKALRAEKEAREAKAKQSRESEQTEDDAVDELLNEVLDSEDFATLKAKGPRPAREGASEDEELEDLGDPSGAELLPEESLTAALKKTRANEARVHDDVEEETSETIDDAPESWDPKKKLKATRASAAEAEVLEDETDLDAVAEEFRALDRGTKPRKESREREDEEDAAIAEHVQRERTEAEDDSNVVELHALESVEAEQKLRRGNEAQEREQKKKQKESLSRETSNLEATDGFGEEDKILREGSRLDEGQGRVREQEALSLGETLLKDQREVPAPARHVGTMPAAETEKASVIKKTSFFTSQGLKNFLGLRDAPIIQQQRPATNTPTYAARMRRNRVQGADEQSFFFRAMDDEQLFRLGDSFYRDYKGGTRHFAFAHMSAGDSQKRSILGVAAFIQYFEDCRILIITDKMDNSFFGQFKKASHKKETETTCHPKLKYEYYQSNNLNFMEIGEIVRKVQHTSDRVRQLPAMIKNLVSDYDVVFFDLPPIPERKDRYDVYLPILQTIESVTFTISLKQNRFSDVNELRKYFTSYKIKIKGSVIENNPDTSGAA